jgi:hypothetical protein
MRCTELTLIPTALAMSRPSTGWLRQADSQRSCPSGA